MGAILLGFGARASNTNRGSGLSSFIKTGRNLAKIVIKLCNYFNDENRCDAYLPDKYGETITIERTIYANGSSRYKIQNSERKTISEKKEEVENITKHFQILVDNPVCVLTQEVSKNFLNSKNPKDKFKFFVKATQLEDVKLDYANANMNKENSVRVLSVSYTCFIWFMILWLIDFCLGKERSYWASQEETERTREEGENN